MVACRQVIAWARTLATGGFSADVITARLSPDSPPRCRWPWRALAISALSVVPILTIVTPAFAYNGNNAASYADTWALSRNPSFPDFGGDDCTNFVSQALHAGGFPEKYISPLQSTSSDHYWFMVFSPQHLWHSNSWSVATDLRSWLIWDVPGGIPEGSFSYDNGKNRAPAFTPNSVITGDVLNYNFGDGRGLIHSSMQVGWGTDQYGYYGNWVDTHATDHKHIFWTLKDSPGNTNWMTTTVYFMHIDSRN
jgi:hypothetical protein